VHPQEVRLEALMKVFNAIIPFFDKVLPDVNYHLDGGSLIAATRGGTMIPWDKDGDIIISSEFNTNKTWARLLEMVEPIQQHGPDCNVTSPNDCFLFMLPSEFDKSGTVGLQLHKLPLDNAAYSSAGSQDHEFFGRAVDLKTGFFVDLENCAIGSDRTNETKQCMLNNTKKCRLGGVAMNVPNNQVENLRQTYDLEDKGGLIEYVGHVKSGMDCKLRKCGSPTGDTIVEDSNADPFTQVFYRPFGNDTNAWKTVHSKTDWPECSEATTPNGSQSFWVMPTCL